MIPEIDKKNIITTDAIVVINQDEKIVAFNESAVRMTGYTEDEVKLTNFRNLFKGSVQDASYITRSLMNAESFSNLSLIITSSNKTNIKVLASITPIKKQEENVISVIFIFRDIKEMHNLLKSLEETSIESINRKHMLEAIFDSRLEGTFTIDKNWTVTSFNSAAETITGYSKKEAIGKKCWDIFHSHLCRNGCQMEYSIDKKKRSVDNELIIKHKKGNKVPIRVNSAPLYNEDGVCIGGVETFLDVTELTNLKTHLEGRFSFENIIGKSKVMQNVFAMLENVAHFESTVLITGESGTGKELVARAIHLNSDRKNKPFIIVNCSAFAETLLESELFGHERGAFTGAIRTKPGHLEMAEGGTLFLDEIGDISLPVQVKLLRVIETKQFERVGGTKTIKMDVRLICATNKNLKQEVSNNNFREDFYYRINVFNIHLPPLKQRLDDLSLLLDHFLEKLRLKFRKNIQTISPIANKLLNNHNWPGNIRELENVLEHAFVLCQSKVIKPEHLPEWLSNLKDTTSDIAIDKINYKDSLIDTEKSLIISTLEKFNNNRIKTAKALGVNKSTLWRKMKKFKLL